MSLLPVNYTKISLKFNTQTTLPAGHLQIRLLPLNRSPLSDRSWTSSPSQRLSSPRHQAPPRDLTRSWLFSRYKSQSLVESMSPLAFFVWVSEPVTRPRYRLDCRERVTRLCAVHPETRDHRRRSVREAGQAGDQAQSQAGGEHARGTNPQPGQAEQRGEVPPPDHPQLRLQVSEGVEEEEYCPCEIFVVIYSVLHTGCKNCICRQAGNTQHWWTVEKAEGGPAEIQSEEQTSKNTTSKVPVGFPAKHFWQRI